MFLFLIQFDREMDAVRADTNKTMLVAKFELSTGAKIDRRNKQEAYQRLSKENEDMIILRRRGLADLYNSEMEQWRSEALAKIETQEDRKAR